MLTAPPSNYPHASYKYTLRKVGWYLLVFFTFFLVLPKSTFKRYPLIPQIFLRTLIILPCLGRYLPSPPSDISTSFISVSVTLQGIHVPPWDPSSCLKVIQPLLRILVISPWQSNVPSHFKQMVNSTLALVLI
jgi:hypothetical protein